MTGETRGLCRDDQPTGAWATASLVRSREELAALARTLA